ncbi:MAG: HAD hydrolase family protein [Eubacteriales bacterium]|nr:HAD hydrolase family protein [Eubacteriales bacterium]
MTTKLTASSEKSMKTRFPIPGQRIVRSVIAVWCCMAVYFLRGRQGALFYSIVAALQCIQPYTANMLKVGRNRIIGTLTGAFWGSIMLFIELTRVGGQYEENLLHFLLLGVFTGIVLYSTVLLDIRESSYFSCVVFMSVALNHIGDENPGLFIFNRTMDTILGVVVGIFICSLHFPRLRDRDTLFVSGVDHVLFRKDRQLTPFTKVEINRFLQDGIRFSVSTKQTPATVRELLAGISLRLPIIAMDGAVLYDLNTRKYIFTEKMETDLAALVTAFLNRHGMPFFVNTIEDDLLVIFYRTYPNHKYKKYGAPASSGLQRSSEQPPAIGAGVSASAPDTAAASPEQQTSGGAGVSASALEAMYRLYLKKNVSPYRNYVRVKHDVTENVLYILVIDKKERIRALYDEFLRQPWADRCRAAFDTFDCGEGEEILRIYAASATRAAMLEKLRVYVGAARTVTFGPVPGECDVLISDAGGDIFVKELKKRFEPVSLRGWKNMLRL